MNTQDNRPSLHCTGFAALRVSKLSQFKNIFFHVCESVYLCVYMHLGLCFVHAEGKKGGWVRGTGVTDGCEVPVGAENYPGSLAEHPALKLLSHLSSPASSFLLLRSGLFIPGIVHTTI